MLYAQYWPEDAGALYGETEVESLYQCINIANPYESFRPTESIETQMEKTSQMN